MSEKDNFLGKGAFGTGAANGIASAPALAFECGGASGAVADVAHRATASSEWKVWSAVGSMALCVALLIAAEFVPVSLLTPIATDLGATAGMAGQAISVSGLFAVVTSLLITTVDARFDRRHIRVGLTGVMLGSLVLIALAMAG